MPRSKPQTALNVVWDVTSLAAAFEAVTIPQAAKLYGISSTTHIIYEIRE
jgi:hypothetical protein